MTLFNKALQTYYHSLHGAVSESRHVFIQHGLATVSNILPVRILELGFGTGLNAFLAYLFSKKNQLEVSYTGIEQYPVLPSVARKLEYPAYLAATAESQVFDRMHRENFFSQDMFSFQLVEDFTKLPQPSLFDCIFFDAFAPSAQPEMWGEDFLRKVFLCTSDHGCLVTYCAQGAVRRTLEKVGYTVHRLPGAPGKREMIRATKIEQPISHDIIADNRL
jgi:tRNA U34 5-methylaminomethyl-2-thiouridine-forming methyltransferase MnmC